MHASIIYSLNCPYGGNVAACMHEPRNCILYWPLCSAGSEFTADKDRANEWIFDVMNCALGSIREGFRPLPPPPPPPPPPPYVTEVMHVDNITFSNSTIITSFFSTKYKAQIKSGAAAQLCWLVCMFPLRKWKLSERMSAEQTSRSILMCSYITW